MVSIAREMRRRGDFSALPFLADAMEDAEFNDIGVLHSARNDPNAGNWIVALVLEEQEHSRKWLQEYADEINRDVDEFYSEMYESAGTRVTIESLLEAAKELHESGWSPLGFGFDLPYGERWMTDEKLEEFRKHSEILLKTTLYRDGDWFQPFSCAC